MSPNPAKAARALLQLSSRFLLTRSRELWCRGVRHNMGWNNTTMKLLPGTQTQGEWCVLYLLHLYLPTLYTLQVATGLFLGHFRDIYFCKSYFWELCQIGSCSNLYLPHKDVYSAASAPLLLLLTAPKEKAHHSVGKKECKINAPTRLGKSQAPRRAAGTLPCWEQQACTHHPGRFPPRRH